MEHMEGFLSQGFTLLGHLVLSYLILKQLWKALKGFRVHFVSRVWRTDLKKYGGWAVVTGATDGIGKSYAEELAKKGYDIILISRSLDKLQHVAKGIEQMRRRTKIIQVDFTGGPEIYPKIEKELKDLDIGILVNNVGMMYNDKQVKFLSVPDVNERVTAVMNCNMTSVVHMTRIVLPIMIQRKNGLIINVSSETGNYPYPMMTMYSATKAFMDYFSRAIHMEYKSNGITVQSVMPLYVSTNMTRNIRSNLFIKSPQEFARDALKTVGHTHRTSGCLSHSIQSYLISLVMTDFLMSSRLMENINKTINTILKARQKQE